MWTLFPLQNPVCHPFVLSIYQLCMECDAPIRIVLIHYHLKTLPPSNRTATFLLRSYTRCVIYSLFNGHWSRLCGIFADDYRLIRYQLFTRNYAPVQSLRRRCTSAYEFVMLAQN